MATPTLTKHTLPGVLGPILVDVRAGDRAASRPAVLVLHGFKGFKDWGMFPPLAERLARAGFHAVSINLSGSGVDDRGEAAYPERFGRATLSGDLRDLATALDALASGEPLGLAPPSSIGLVGHSRGGGTAILATAADPRIAALATWAAISHPRRWTPEQVRDWRETGAHDVTNARTGQVIPLRLEVLDDMERHAAGLLDIGGAAARIAVPWLLVHGTADEAVPFGEGEALAAASEKSTTRFLRVEGAGHTFGAAHPLRETTPDLAAVMAATVSWMSAHLG